MNERKPGIERLRDGFVTEIRRHRETYEERRNDYPDLDAYPSPELLLALFADMDEKRYPEKERITRILLVEHLSTAEPHPLWSALLVLAYFPMLKRLRDRARGVESANGFDADQMVLEAFLAVVEDEPLYEKPDRLALHLRQATQQRLFAQLKERRRADVAHGPFDEEAARRPRSKAASGLPAPPPPKRPPAGEVAALWASCTSVFDDSELRGQLKARAIDAATMSDRDLARALPVSVRVPSWARLRGRSWAEVGNRLILPMFDAVGAMVTLHARRLGSGNTSKGLSPAGHRVAGAVFADPLGRMLLASGLAPDWWLEHIVIVEEGAPDFLAVATHYGDDERTPVVFGVIAGAWTDEIGARVPDGCHVIIRTHGDAAGDKYAATVGASLVNRCHLSRAEAA